MPEPALLAVARRGDVPEIAVRGNLAVVDRDGRLVASAGDPNAITTLRSCVKPIQALPFVEHAASSLGAGDADLAIACASHAGQPEHVMAVDHLLGLAGIDRSALRCGPQLPFDEPAARALLAGGGKPGPVHNNCSGKHAAMLAGCAVLGLPLDGYLEAGHPYQRLVTDALSDASGIDLAAVPWGIDGCGLRTYGVSLRKVAESFVRMEGDVRFERCRSAMAAAPDLVAGTGRWDTELLRGHGDRLTAKSGGAGVWAAVVPERRFAVAMKLEAGIMEALPPVALAALQALGVLDPDPVPALAEFVSPLMANWAGAPVGRIVVEGSWLLPLRAAADDF